MALVRSERDIPPQASASGFRFRATKAPSQLGLPQSVDGLTHRREATMMICDRRTVLALAGSVLLTGPAFAKHNHHDGVKLLGSKISTDGKHEIHKNGEHTVHVHVQGKKIAGVTVTHRTKGEVPVKKYKTSKKMVEGDGNLRFAAETTGDLIQPVDFRVAQTIVSIGYSYIDPVTGDEEIYWYPAEMVIDPLTGAVDYIPLT
jgi:hypothetical protein